MALRDPYPQREPVKGESKSISSSFIKDVKYDYQTMDLTIYMRRGRSYTYPNITARKFHRFMLGKAVCVTDDPTGRNRWYRGKTRSLGAFYNQFIKLGGIRGVRVLRASRARVTGFFRRGRETAGGVDDDT